MLKEVEGTQQVHQIQFTEVLFWVRLHDLSLIARNEYISNLIGSSISWVEEVDIDQGEMDLGEFMRVRVAIDVGKPLLRGKKMNMGTDKSCWVQFAYERLLNFCYCSGRLGHTQ